MFGCFEWRRVTWCWFRCLLRIVVVPLVSFEQRWWRWWWFFSRLLFFPLRCPLIRIPAKRESSTTMMAEPPCIRVCAFVVFFDLHHFLRFGYLLMLYFLLAYDACKRLTRWCCLMPNGWDDELFDAKLKGHVIYHLYKFYGSFMHYENNRDELIPFILKNKLYMIDS